MKPLSQKLVIGLAIAITMLFSLIVAIICSATLQKKPPTVEQTLPTQADTTIIQSPPLINMPETASGLRFVANGNGECVLAGIGSCEDACVVIPEYAPTGERVVEIAAMAFYGCETITAIGIPASVRKIGNLAFAACKNLGYISVKPENKSYRDIDGVLYTADESTLILYPPGRVGNTVNINTATTAVADMAFFDCTHLSHVVYAGSAEEWDRIRIGIRNHSLTAASKSFSGGISTTNG